MSSAHAGTFVYVSNAEDGDISTYTMAPATGKLTAGPRVPAQKFVMPMAVSPDRKHLYAAARSKPFTVYTYAIDGKTGALNEQAKAELPDSLPYISTDKTGRFLFGASFGGDIVSVTAIGTDGKVNEPAHQVLKTGRNAHSIRVDKNNRYVFVPLLGTDEVLQYRFDVKTGTLSPNAPPSVKSKAAGVGPRHFAFSPDNKFVYVINEMVATITTYKLDDKTGLLTELESVQAFPPGAPVKPGKPRVPTGPATPGVPPPPDPVGDIWAADIHMTPNGKFIYSTERETSTLNAFKVDGMTGKLTYIQSYPTEKQPRGFAIDSKGKFLVASGEKSGNLSVYRIDGANGQLTLDQQYPVGKGANWVEIVETR